MNLALILVLLTATAGVIWALDSLFWRRARGLDQREPFAVEYARSFFPVLAIVLVLRSFIFEPFQIPSGSMIPTLRIGDFIVVSKFSYGLKLPVSDTQFVDVGKPKRGDVAVFRFPKNPSEDYIKRIVGLPGDIVEYRDKVLFINGEEAKQTVLGDFVDEQGQVHTNISHVREVIGDVSHEILIEKNRPGRVGNFRTRIPEGQYFAMGDNRDNSNDSRYWGPVPEGNLVGRAKAVWMNFSWDHGGVQWQRIGTLIE